MADDILADRMNRWVPILIALPLLAVACKRKTETAAPPQLPAAETAEAKAPAAPTPTPTFTSAPPAQISISDQVFDFGPAKLVLAPTASGMQATLYADPLAGAQRQNSFSFIAQFDANSPDEVSGQVYTWKKQADDVHDTVSSIFLNNRRQTVQPLEATLTLTKNPDGQWTAGIDGRFNFIDDQAADDTPVITHVTAQITADLVTPPQPSREPRP